MSQISQPIPIPNSTKNLYLSAFPPPEFPQILSMIPNCPNQSIPFADTHGVTLPLQEIIETMEKMVGQGDLLVHCERGVSRCVTAVMAFLIHKGMGFEQAHELVKSKWSRAYPNPNFQRQLRIFAKKMEQER